MSNLPNKSLKKLYKLNSLIKLLNNSVFNKQVLKLLSIRNSLLIKLTPSSGIYNKSFKLSIKYILHFLLFNLLSNKLESKFISFIFILHPLRISCKLLGNCPHALTLDGLVFLISIKLTWFLLSLLFNVL